MKKLICIGFVSFMFMTGCGDDSVSSSAIKEFNSPQSYVPKSCKVNADCDDYSFCDKGTCNRI